MPCSPYRFNICRLLLRAPLSAARESFHFPCAWLSCLHTWFSHIGCAVAHQSPIRIKAGAPCSAWPLAAFAAPENPLFPTVSNTRGLLGTSAGRTDLWLRRVAIQPLVAHGTGATNSDAGAGSARGVQSGLMVLPTPKRHCRGRPIDRFAPYPKALDTSKGLPSFMTCQHARASLCATALMATTVSPLAHFFWYQRLMAAS